MLSLQKVMCSYAFLGWKSLSGGAATNFLSRLCKGRQMLKLTRFCCGSNPQEDQRSRGKGDCGHVEEDSCISSWGTKVEGRQELQTRLPTPQGAECQCGLCKMNREVSGRKELCTVTPRVHSSQQGVSAGGHASRCSGQSRLKAGMQVRGVDQRYLQPWRQECVWLRTLRLFSRREILSDWSPIHQICLKFALYVFVVFVHMVSVTISLTLFSLQCVTGILEWVLWSLCRGSMLLTCVCLARGFAGVYAEGRVILSVVTYGTHMCVCPVSDSLRLALVSREWWGMLVL